MRTFRFYGLLVMAIFASNFSNLAQADSYSNAIDVFKKSPAVQLFFQNAYGYAVFPTIGKAGLGIGGAYGEGKVYREGKLTGTASLIKLSIGWQAGGQALSEIIFFQDKRAYDEFTSAVSRVSKTIAKDKKVRKKIDKLINKLNHSRFKT